MATGASCQQTDYSILTLAQLYFFIDEAQPVSQFYTDFSWIVTDTITIEGSKISKMEIRKYAMVSYTLLNRGYRIVAECVSDNVAVLLCEGENTDAGNQKVNAYWKDL